MLKTLASLFPLHVSAGPFAGTKCRLTDTGDGIVAKPRGDV
jgi:hypothetical protein